MTNHTSQAQSTSEPSHLLWRHQLRRENRHLQTQLRNLEASLSSHNTMNQNRDTDFQSLSQRLEGLERRLDQERSTSALLAQAEHRLVEAQRELRHYADERALRLEESLNEHTAIFERKFEEVRVQLEELSNMSKGFQEQISGLENTFSNLEFLRNTDHQALGKIAQELTGRKALLSRKEVMTSELRNFVTSIARSELNRKEQLDNLERILIGEQILETQPDSRSLAGTDAARGGSMYVQESEASRRSASSRHSGPSQTHPDQPLAPLVEDENLTNRLQRTASSPLRIHGTPTGSNTLPATTPQVWAVTTSQAQDGAEVDAGRARSLSQATTQPITEIDLDDVVQQQQHISQSNPFRLSPPLLASANQSPTSSTKENVESLHIPSPLACAISPEMPQGIAPPQVLSPRAPSPAAPLPRRRKPNARASVVPPPTDRQTRSQARAAEAALQQSVPGEIGQLTAGAEDPRLNEQSTKIESERAEKTSRSRKSSVASRKRNTAGPKKPKMNTDEQSIDARNMPDDSSNLAEAVKEEHLGTSQETDVAKKRKCH